MANTIGYARNRLFAVLGFGLLTGCSGMQPTPMMPTYPAQIGGPSGVSMESDSLCRQQAYQAAEKVKQDNVNKEVAFTAIGTIAGAVIGNQIQSPGRYGPPRGPRGPGGPGGPGRPRTNDMAGAGALAGAATGAALSQGTLQNTQQVYDIYYNNCIERYRNYR
ncbi:YMGG-like glycine zipper-containing protein [Allochromatium palmeri]|nr:YMGG-like glycine zipper-containing protein [Allochromatium palmeri]